MLSQGKIPFNIRLIHRRFLSNNTSNVKNNIRPLKLKNNLISSKNARVIICGGGVMGASVAYHLGRIGWGSDTILIEQGR